MKEDTIENINRELLFTMVEKVDFLAVFFCEYKLYVSLSESSTFQAILGFAARVAPHGGHAPRADKSKLAYTLLLLCKNDICS